ncbi:MAG: protein kinase domain-containing protein [Fimbriiglobus sp.]
MKTRSATLKDGRLIPYVEVEDPPQGGMKRVYFSPDRSEVVAFFHDKAASTDPNRMARLDAVVGKYNPTLDSETGAYWKQLFCWPTAIAVKPELAVVAPCYPGNFFFATGPFKGKEKKGKWFSSPKLRGYLPEAERGTLSTYFQICIRMARAVRRLHAAGLAHSDLSCNNVLIDPVTGQCVVIDIDSLVVPGMFPPDVLGTPGYIAPEVLMTTHLPLNDPKRKNPSTSTDLHALGVLIHEYLLFRHPLVGPKIHPATSTEEQVQMEMASAALYIEHPTDRSNRPADLTATAADFGPPIADLFQRVFVKGLNSPNDRPAAIEWERALVKTWDLLHPCGNAKCTHKWFVVHGPTATTCPFCKTKVPEAIPMLKLRKEARPGQWQPDGTVAIHEAGTAIYGWHVFDNQYPGEKADRTRLGYFAKQDGKWLLVNEGLPSLTSPGGNRVAVGSAIELAVGKSFRLSQDAHGRMAEVEFYSRA